VRLLRQARQSDLDALIELARRSWLSAFAQTAPFPMIAAWAASDALPERYRAFWREMHVLEEDGVVLGLVQPKEAEINGLWVHPTHQGKGAGVADLLGPQRPRPRLLREAGLRGDRTRARDRTSAWSGRSSGSRAR